MGRLDGKVALVTGAARGIGRAQAIRFAEEGANLMVVDIAQDLGTVPYHLASPEDLKATVREVQTLGQRAIFANVDVRDLVALETAAKTTAAELGRLDIVVASAGVVSYGEGVALDPALWREAVDINLLGVWNTIRATVPHIRAGKRGGSIAITGSVAGLRPYADHAHYVATKHGVLGLARALALELASEFIRVNVLAPGGVATAMIHNAATFATLAPELSAEERTAEALAHSFQRGNALPVPWVEPVDVANATLFLVSDEARYITGVALPVDAGALLV